MKKIYGAVVLMLCTFVQAQSQTVSGYTCNVDSTAAYSVVAGVKVVLGCPVFFSGDESAVVTLRNDLNYNFSHRP